MPKPRKTRTQPLNEVFGYPVGVFTKAANDSRAGKLCPYNNGVPECTKDKADDPLGVCSMVDAGSAIMLCPVRLRQGWSFVNDVAPFLLPGTKTFKFVTEIPLVDAEGKGVGKFDGALVKIDGGKIADFGLIELQTVYVTGNIRNPFEYYMGGPTTRWNHVWTGPNYPRPDWLSSIKRLVRQLTVKGVILKSWGKKTAVVVQKQFYEEMGLLKTVPKKTEKTGDMAWYLYDLIQDSHTKLFGLQLQSTEYMTYDDAMAKLSVLEAGDIGKFEQELIAKLPHARTVTV